jgi:hypothetical protein
MNSRKLESNQISPPVVTALLVARIMKMRTSKIIVSVINYYQRAFS